MHVKRILMLLALALLLVAPAGCIFSPGGSDDPPVGGDPLPFPETREQLMLNFQTTYETRTIDYYREVIDPSFVIYLKQDTINDFGLPRDFFDYDEEVQIATNMFSGNSITRGDGSIVPGITTIEFSTFNIIDEWTDTPADDRIPNAKKAQYDVEIRIEQGNLGRLNITGIIEFYLVNKPVEHNGKIRDRWWMVGQVDYTNSGAGQ